LMGEPAPNNFTVPSSADVAAFHKLMASVETALRVPPQTAQGKLAMLQASVGTLHPFFQRATPSFSKINERRIEVQVARDRLLQALAK
jgi:hypothetical protein